MNWGKIFSYALKLINTKEAMKIVLEFLKQQVEKTDNKLDDTALNVITEILKESELID